MPWRVGCARRPGIRLVLRVAEYRQHAEDCRRLAAKAAAPQVRDELLKMAATWTKIADDRERKIAAQTTVDGAPPPPP